MTTIRVPKGSISISHSYAQCPHCQKAITIDEVDEKLMKADNKNKGYIRYKCKGCTRFIGVAMAYNGEVQSFELKILNSPVFKPIVQKLSNCIDNAILNELKKPI